MSSAFAEASSASRLRRLGSERRSSGQRTVAKGPVEQLSGVPASAPFTAEDFGELDRAGSESSANLAGLRPAGFIQIALRRAVINQKIFWVPIARGDGMAHEDNICVDSLHRFGERISGLRQCCRQQHGERNDDVDLMFSHVLSRVFEESS